MFADWTEQEQRRLGLENIFKECFPDQTYQGTKNRNCSYKLLLCVLDTVHRTLEDVKAMDQVFQTAMFASNPSLASFDDNLKKAGIKMKSWRTKLWNHFSKRK